MSAQLKSAFDQEMQLAIGVDHPEIIAVALSGGSDSLALSYLAKAWCLKHNIALVTYTVDHGLRSEAADEARLVAQWMSVQGIEHHILKREGEAPSTGIQEFARNARYELLLQACKARGIKHLLLGHQLEDQLETFLLRLSKGSSLNGLRSMQQVRLRKGVKLIRPLLGCRRQSLREFLVEKEADWIEDPSNEKEEFTRTDLGRVLRSIADLPGSNLNAIALTLQRVQRAEEEIQISFEQAKAQYLTVTPYGLVSLQREFLNEVSAEIAIRLILDALRLQRGPGVHVKLTDIEALYEELSSSTDVTTRTLSGCYLQFSESHIEVWRELGRMGLEELTLSTDDETLWDNRFVVFDARSGADGPFVVKALGEKGWQEIRESIDNPLVGKIPYPVRIGLPSVWQNGNLVSVPLILAENWDMSIAKERFSMVFSPLVDLENPRKN